MSVCHLLHRSMALRSPPRTCLVLHAHTYLLFLLCPPRAYARFEIRLLAPSTTEMSESESSMIIAPWFRPVWQGLSTDSLKFQPGSPCLTFLCPGIVLRAGGLWPVACGRLLPPWIPHAVRAWLRLQTWLQPWFPTPSEKNVVYASIVFLWFVFVLFVFVSLLFVLPGNIVSRFFEKVHIYI
jgi:hypothetical protein